MRFSRIAKKVSLISLLLLVYGCQGAGFLGLGKSPPKKETVSPQETEGQRNRPTDQGGVSAAPKNPQAEQPGGENVGVNEKPVPGSESNLPYKPGDEVNGGGSGSSSGSVAGTDSGTNSSGTASSGPNSGGGGNSAVGNSGAGNQAGSGVVSGSGSGSGEATSPGGAPNEGLPSSGTNVTGGNSGSGQSGGSSTGGNNGTTNSSSGSNSGSGTVSSGQNVGNPSEGFPTGGAIGVGGSGQNTSTGGQNTVVNPPSQISTGTNGGSGGTVSGSNTTNPNEGFPIGAPGGNNSTVSSGGGGGGSSTGQNGSGPPSESFPGGNGGSTTGNNSGQGISGSGGNGGQSVGQNNPPKPPYPAPPGRVWLELTVVQAVHESWWKNCLWVSVEGTQEWKKIACNKDADANGKVVFLLANARPACNKLQVFVETYHNQGNVCNIRMQQGLPCEGPYAAPGKMDYSRNPVFAHEAVFYRIYGRISVKSPDPLIRSNANWEIPDFNKLSEAMGVYREASGLNKWLRVFFEDQPKENLNAVKANPANWKRYGIDFNDYVFDVKGRNVFFNIQGSGLSCESR